MTALPGILAEIAEIAGRDAALAVAKAKGGTQAYFPTRPGPNHWLSKCVGLENARAIGRELGTGHGGVELLVPMGPSATKAAIWRKMHEMIDAGHSKATIARTCNVHVRTVQLHRNGKVKTAESLLDQSDLFD